MNQSLIVDMDGVLYPWAETFLELYLEFACERSLPAGFRWCWDFAQLLPNRAAVNAVDRSSRLWTRGSAYPGSLDALLRLMAGPNRMWIATHPGPYPEIAVPGKVEWLRRHAPWFPLENVVFLAEKEILRGDAIVDDRPSNVANWLRANPRGVGYLVDRPWNQGAGAHARQTIVRGLADMAEALAGAAA